MVFDVKTRVSRLISSAKARGIHVNLDLNKYQNLIDIGCHYCGSSLVQENGYCLDRVDSSKGYIITNVVACCKICNRAKSNMSVMEFVDWLERAGVYTKKKIDSVINSKIEYSFQDELSLHRELSKDKQKQRIKYVP